MKKMKLILIIAAVITVLCCILLWVRHGISDHGGVLDGDGMVNPYAVSTFSYYRGGGMENEHYRVTLEQDELTVETRIGEKTKRKKYRVPDDTLRKIENTLYDSGMKEWNGDFPDSEYFALDEDTTSISIDYADGTHIEFESTQEVPDEGWSAVKETMRLLEAIADK